jgi:transcriptional regulator with XRE-family HTH domain
MTLREYLETKKLSDGKFAAMIGRDRTTVLRLRLGRRRPDWETIAVIAEATGGLVTANDFVSRPITQPPQQAAV